MMAVFIIPNKPIKDVSLTEFQVSLEQLEKYVGTRFHYKLDRSKVSFILLRCKDFINFIFLFRLKIYVQLMGVN